MKMKNDCERDYIKEAFDKLYNFVMPYIDLTQFADADTAFKELDKKVHSEIYILKKCLSERDRAVDAGITRSKVLQERIRDLEKELSETKHSEDIYHRSASDLDKENDRLREVIDELENEINDLKKNIRDLEEENADLHERLSSDKKSIETLVKSNSILRGDNEILWARLKERDLDISKRPWHGDGNAMTDTRTCHKSLAETIEELNAKKTRLEENVDLSYGHEFEFGDEVFVPWSCDPYMYIKSGQLYNPRTKRLVYVGKDQHLKWFGEKFAIV